MNENKVYCSPESVGLSSDKVIDFIRYVKESGYNLHSFMLIKDGKIITEAYYAPFCETDKKRLYSCSKTIAALAVGRLVDEGLVNIDDPLVKYFPEHRNCHPELRKITVEDALKMTLPLSSSPYVYGKSNSSVPNDIVVKESWIDIFFSGVMIDPQQKKSFKYNSHASYMLGALPYKLTGQSFVEYLRPMFDKIGVSRDIKCVNSPEGIAWASSGVLCTMRDFAKIGELLLNKGYMYGEQLLPRDYMERATSALVSTPKTEGNSVSCCGYGYQIWSEPYGFGMHGMLGQCAFCFPDKNFLFICHSNTPDYLEPIYKGAAMLYENIGDLALLEGEGYSRLRDTLSSLKIERACGAAHSPIESVIDGACYEISENPMGITSLRFDLSAKFGTLTYTRDGGERVLRFGYGEYLDTTFPETYYYSMTITEPADRELRALVTGSFPNENEMVIVSDVSDTMYGTLTMRFKFEGDTVSLIFKKNGEAIFDEYVGEAEGKRRQ